MWNRLRGCLAACLAAGPVWPLSVNIIITPCHCRCWRGLAARRPGGARVLAGNNELHPQPGPPGLPALPSTISRHRPCIMKGGRCSVASPAPPLCSSRPWRRLATVGCGGRAQPAGPARLSKRGAYSKEGADRSVAERSATRRSSALCRTYNQYLQPYLRFRETIYLSAIFFISSLRKRKQGTA